MKFLKGNLLTAENQALVNTVNTVGVMGKGIALQFKRQFPQNFRVYAAACKKQEFSIGDLIVVREATLYGDQLIINFPTKTDWFKKSQHDFIESGLKTLAEVIVKHHITSIAIPALGCGNGGLEWGKVRPMIEQHLGHLSEVDIQIFEPN